jgi:fatty acid-binding protein DegV
MDRLIELALAEPDATTIWVAAAGDDAAETLAERIRAARPGVDVRVGALGPAVGAHSGPGLLGVCPVRGLSDDSASD